MSAVTVRKLDADLAGVEVRFHGEEVTDAQLGAVAWLYFDSLSKAPPPVLVGHYARAAARALLAAIWEGLRRG